MRQSQTWTKGIFTFIVYLARLIRIIFSPKIALNFPAGELAHIWISILAQEIVALILELEGR